MYCILVCTSLLLLASIKALNVLGPKGLDEEIAIIGGGMSAIHMAYLMQQRGFTNVHILVEGDRLGGDDVHTVNHRGTNHEMGKHMLIPTLMSKELDDLALKYEQDAFTEISAASVWSMNTDNEHEVNDLLQHLTEKVRGNAGAKLSEAQLKSLMISSIDKFRSKVTSLIKITDELPEEASWGNKFQLYGSFEDFLVKDGNQPLVPLFTYLFSIMGYGSPKDFSVYYGIFFFRPQVLDQLKSTIQSMGFNGIPGFKVSAGGLESLLGDWSLGEEMNVTRNVHIHRIVTRTSYHGKHKIIMTVDGGQKNGWYDFIVYAGCLKTYIARNLGRSQREYQMFLRPKTKYLIKTLVDSVNVARGLTPLDYYTDSFTTRGTSDYDMAFSVDSYAAYKGYSGSNYQNYVFPNNPRPSDKSTSAVYTQMSDADKVDVAEANRKLTSYLSARGGQGINIVQTKVYKFFTKYQGADLNNGMLHEIMKEQGKHGVWYIGQSVYLDNIVSMFGYNKMLIGKWKLGTSGGTTITTARPITGASTTGTPYTTGVPSSGNGGNDDNWPDDMH